eukprot:gene682-8934_t
MADFQMVKFFNFDFCLQFNFDCIYPFTACYSKNLHYFLKTVKFQTYLNSFIWLYSIEGISLFFDSKIKGEKKDLAKDLLLTSIEPFDCILSMKNLSKEFLSKIEQEDELNYFSDFIVNPSFEVQKDHSLKRDPNSKIPSNFRICVTDIISISSKMKRPTFILEDPGYKMICTFGTGEEYKDLIEILKANENLETYRDQLNNFSNLDLKFLKFNKVFVKKNYWQERVEFFKSFTTQERIKFHQNGFLIFKNLLPPLQFYNLKIYFDNYLKHIKQHNENENFGFFFTWKSLVAHYFNLKMIELLTEITKENICSRLPLTLFYETESQLPLHFDSYPYCYSCSFLLSKQKDQPLTIITESNKNRVIDIILDEGDSIFFKGLQLPHYRRKSKLSLNLFLNSKKVESGAAISMSMSFQVTTS